MKKKTAKYVMLTFLAGCLLMGCGAEKETASVPETAANEETAADEEAAQETMKEYTVGGMSVSLPEGFEAGEAEQGGMGTHYELWKGEVCFFAGYFSPEDYEKAGVSVPADVEEYSQRAGVRQELPEGTEFSENKYGNFCTEYEREDDGRKFYLVLLKGKEGMWSYGISAPEAEYDSEKFASWLSTATEK